MYLTIRHRFYLTVFFSFFVFISCNIEPSLKDKERIKNIGENLIQLDTFYLSTTNSNNLVKDVVNIGESLYNEIQRNKPFGNSFYNVEKVGSLFSSKYMLEIKSENKIISIMLRYDDKYDKYHITGYYSK